MNLDDIETTLRDIPFRTNFKVKVLSDVESLPRPLCIIPSNNFECYIINYHGKNTRMGHWISVCKNDREICFYDSMGFPPEFYTPRIYDHIKNHCDMRKIRNKRQFQSFSTIVCGGYQILFIYFLHQTQNFIKALRKMDKLFPHQNRHILNDIILLKYLYKHFKSIGPCKKLFCNYYSITKDLCNSLCTQ